ncbi:hypothetical protein Halhy_1459 [Haliscomenobacter hydrossis DSM 1100]|uniref:Uncharacterized protein n=1 Tax=Haliscomenobacter hydrossis (strain ATCC 27775 / DSM 1100 / LMG 10767 / O) TaxID=760192 RepID=F4KXE5_HALH1|nr:hypothetical protein Halhy_1459 [Haliscomenobacter hydrossis DSM 1100]
MEIPRMGGKWGVKCERVKVWVCWVDFLKKVDTKISQKKAYFHQLD